jgi:hypothetical protein
MMSGYACEMELEVGLSVALSEWTVSGSRVFAVADVLPGHTAWPRIFGLEDAATESQGLEGAQLARLDRPLITVYGSAALAEGDAVAVELEAMVRTPWRRGAAVHAYLVDGFRQYLGTEAAVTDFEKWRTGAGTTKYSWTLATLGWNDEADRARWENSFDGWHWVSSGTLYANVWK